MKQYLTLLETVMSQGVDRGDRTGTGTRGVFGYQMRFDLEEGFPLLTTKKLHLKSVLNELLFFLNGETNNRWLNERGVTIWDEWQDPNGNLGPIYGHQWRNFGGKVKNIPQPKAICINPTIFGVATPGTYKRGEDPLKDKLYITWKGILNRCYNPKKDSFSYYGEKGVHVENSWLNFDTFFEEVQTISNWDQKLSNWDQYVLDKDILGNGFCYGKNSCVWVTISENQRAKYHKIYTVRNEKLEITETFRIISDFISKYSLSQSNFCAMLRGERPHCENWYIISVKDLHLGIDQISNVVNSIKTNPDSRRHIVSAWNPAEIEDMALPPCHCLFQFYVSEGRLSCQLYQRSADIFLGVPFNIASYALLTMMIAQVCGLKPGEFIHTLGDAHIYHNHFDQVKEQLTRKPTSLPRMEINPDKKDIFSFVYDDFKLLNYVSQPSIKAPIAV